MIDRRGFFRIVQELMSASAFMLTVQPALSKMVAPIAPRLAGKYAPTTNQHPFVFASRETYEIFLSREGGAFSKSRSLLEKRVKGLVNSAQRYTDPFKGCNLNRYLTGLTYEYGGAARAAADLASYAYLFSLGRGYGDEHMASQAGNIAKSILINWATEGFRVNMTSRLQFDQFCDNQGNYSESTRLAVGLQIGRGMPNWVHAQDLLSAIGLISASEELALVEFLGEVSRLVSSSANYRAQVSNLDCNRYSNHVSVQLLAMISIARLRNDRKSLEDAGFGASGGVLIPWSLQVKSAIYSERGRVLNCYRNGEALEFKQVPEVRKGELVDRYRAGETQTFGYTMYSLTNLIVSANVLRSSGYDSYGLLSGSVSPMLDALHYYGPYFSEYLSNEKAVIPETSSYPGSLQYVGKVISNSNGETIEGNDGLLLPFIAAADVYKGDTVIRAVFETAGRFKPVYFPYSKVSPIFLPLLIHCK